MRKCSYIYTQLHMYKFIHTYIRTYVYIHEQIHKVVNDSFENKPNFIINKTLISLLNQQNLNLYI